LQSFSLAQKPRKWSATLHRKYKGKSRIGKLPNVGAGIFEDHRRQTIVVIKLAVQRRCRQIAVVINSGQLGDAMA
jgi:hypothetical protein